jgi:hypothetical protein
MSLKNALTKASIYQIDENALLDGVVKILDGYEAFSDTSDLNEKLYMGTVFSDILGEDFEKKKTHPTQGIQNQKTLAQLNELNNLVNTDYFMVINTKQ